MDTQIFEKAANDHSVIDLHNVMLRFTMDTFVE